MADDDAERRRFALAKRIAGWGDAPASVHVDTIQLILSSDTEMHCRLLFYCDANHAAEFYGPERDVDELLKQAAKIPRRDWRDETSLKREGRPGHGVSVSTRAFHL